MPLRRREFCLTSVIRRIDGLGVVILGDDATKHVIASIANNAGTLQITTVGPSNLSGGTIFVTGTSVAAYNNVTMTVTGNVSATVFNTSTAFTSIATGGQWY